MKMGLKKIAFIFYALGILSFLIFNKFPPHSLMLNKEQAPITFANNSLGLRTPEDQSEATYTYLGNPQRQSLPAPLAAPLRELWRYENLNIGIHGASKASPAVDESGVYVGSDSGWFYAFDHKGNVKWKFLFGANNMGIHGTALLDEKYVYVGAYNGRFYCLNKENGKVLWVVRLANAVGSSPLLWGRDILVSAETMNPRNGYLVRINSSDGKVLWRSSPFREQVHSSPTLSPDGSLAYVGDNLGAYRAFRTDSGAEVWRADMGGPVKGTAPWHEGFLYVTSWGKKFSALDAQTGKEVWRVDLPGPSQSSPQLIGGFAVFGSAPEGNILGVDLKKRKIAWNLKTGTGGGMGSFTPITWNRKEAALGYCGKKILCILNPTNGKKLGQFSLPGPLTGVPVVYENKIFLAIDQGPLLVLQGGAEINH